MVKNPPANVGNARDACVIHGSGSSPGGENGKPLQYSYRENSLDIGAWQATVQGVTKSRTQLSIHMHNCFMLCYVMLCMLVSAVPHSESAICTHISPPS